MVEVTEEEVKNSVRLIPSWTTVVSGWGQKVPTPGRAWRRAWAPPETCSVLGPMTGPTASWLASPVAGPEPTVSPQTHRNKVTLFSLMVGRPGGVVRRVNDLNILTLAECQHSPRLEKHFLPSFLRFIELLLFSRHWTRCQGHDRGKASDAFDLEK